MLKIKDWLKSRENKQFEILDAIQTGRWIASVIRLSDGKIFNRGQIINRNDFKMFLHKFYEDKIHVNVNVSKELSPGVRVSEYGFQIAINEIETWNPKFDDDVER